MSIIFSPLTFGKHGVIYGEDNRYDAINYHNPDVIELARSTLAFILTRRLVKVEGGYRLRHITMKRENLCDDEPFVDQLAVGFCTGFLIAPNKVATAGHCIKKRSECRETSFVLDFAADYDTDFSKPYIIPEKNVFKCKDFYSSFKAFYKVDYGIVTLDRPVTNRRLFQVRTEGKISDNTQLIALGYPWGLPLKITDNGKILSNKGTNYLVTDLDLFAGNSGSPIINGQTHKVESIVQSGEPDFEYDFRKRCFRARKCSTQTDCKGENSLRITKAKYVQEIVKHNTY